MRTIFKKKAGLFSILSATKLSFLAPLANVGQACEATKDGILNGILKLITYAKYANFARKDLYTANINVGNFHRSNGNMFDAKMRYKMAFFFKKTETKPLLILAEIAISENKSKKTIKYLEKAIKISNNEEEKMKISSILNGLKND